MALISSPLPSVHSLLNLIEPQAKTQGTLPVARRMLPNLLKTKDGMAGNGRYSGLRILVNSISIYVTYNKQKAIHNYTAISSSYTVFTFCNLPDGEIFQSLLLHFKGVRYESRLRLHHHLMMQNWEIDQHGTGYASSGDVEVIAIMSVARTDISVNVYQDCVVEYEVRDRTTPHISAKDNIQRSIGCLCHQNSLLVD